MSTNVGNREEEFELILGNKQLLSLFFIVVGFFAAFFSVGYMVGFGHGEKTVAASGLPRVEEPAPKPKESSLPATLMQEAPAPPPAAPAASVASAPKPSPTESAPPQAQAVEPPPPPKQTTPERPVQAAAPKPSPTTPAPAPAAASQPKPAAAPADGSYYLQVAAVRVASDASELADKLKAKGYPATVNATKGDGWQRVVVGPFQSTEAAQSFKARLAKDGFDTMLRKL